MVKQRIKYWIIIIFGVTAAIIIAISIKIYKQPAIEAAARNKYEDSVIERYQDNNSKEITYDKESMTFTEGDAGESERTYEFSDINSYDFAGFVDAILVIEKINLKKAIIRGNSIEDNEHNLDRYYFVTADLTSTLSENYIIYGHSSQTYGHSFNRLDEIEVSDTFYINQKDVKYEYVVVSKDKVLRSDSAEFFQPKENQATLVSCERVLQPDAQEKRIIIIKAKQISRVND